jgi:hypothetical protein
VGGAVYCVPYMAQSVEQPTARWHCPLGSDRQVLTPCTHQQGRPLAASLAGAVRSPTEVMHAVVRVLLCAHDCLEFPGRCLCGTVQHAAECVHTVRPCIVCCGALPQICNHMHHWLSFWSLRTHSGMSSSYTSVATHHAQHAAHVLPNPTPGPGIPPHCPQGGAPMHNMLLAHRTIKWAATTGNNLHVAARGSSSACEPLV